MLFVHCFENYNHLMSPFSHKWLQVLLVIPIQEWKARGYYDLNLTSLFLFVFHLTLIFLSRSRFSDVDRDKELEPDRRQLTEASRWGRFGQFSRHVRVIEGVNQSDIGRWRRCWRRKSRVMWVEMQRWWLGQGRWLWRRFLSVIENLERCRVQREKD